MNTTTKSKHHPIASRRVWLGSTLWMLLALCPVGVGRAHAQECDATRPVIFSFDGSTPLVTLSVTELKPKTLTSSYGIGAVQFDDGEHRLPLVVRARMRGSRITYVASGREADIRFRATIVTEECRSSITKVKVRLQTATSKARITDPALVGFAGIVKSGVVVLDKESVGNLAVPAGDPSTFTVPSADPLAARLEAGKIVMVAETPATPEGLLVRITDVQDDGVLRTHHTETVPIGEAFDALDIAVGGAPDEPDGLSASAADGDSRPSIRMRFDSDFSLPGSSTNGVYASVQSDIARSNLTVDRNFSVIFPQTTLRDGLGRSVTLGGSLIFAPQVVLELKLKGPCLFGVCAPCPVPGCSVKAKFQLTGQSTVNLRASATQAIAINAEKKLTTVTWGAITVGPVVFVPTFTPKIGITATTSGSAYVDISASGGVTVGAQCSSRLPLLPTCSPIFALTERDVTGNASDLSASVAFEPHVSAELALKVYGMLGPYIAPKAYVRTTIPSSGTWKVEGGAKLAVGLDLTVWEFISLTLAEKEFDIYTKVIRSGTITAPPPPGPPPGEVWCGHPTPVAPYGNLERCYWRNPVDLKLHLAYYSADTEKFSSLFPLQPLDAKNWYIPEVTICGEPNQKFQFFGGPKVDTGGFGDVSYGELRWNPPVLGTVLRWGQYSFHPGHLCFHPDGGWRDDVIP